MKSSATIHCFGVVNEKKTRCIFNEIEEFGLLLFMFCFVFVFFSEREYSFYSIDIRMLAV